MKEFLIPININVKPKLSVTPKFLFLGRYNSVEDYTPRFIKVSYMGESPKTIKVTAHPTNIICNTEVHDEETRIYININEKQFTGEINSKVKIKVDSDEIYIPVKGYIGKI